MGDIDTRLFRYFVALAEEMHFGRAAQRLQISPPTLTNQIKKLEDRLGTKLFSRTERKGSSTELTEGGRRLLDRARIVLRETQEAEQVAKQTARGEIGRLEIGHMTAAVLAGLMDTLIGSFRRTHPGIEILVRQMVTIEQINAIIRKDLDFGFVRPPERYAPELRGFVVYQQAMVLALAADHPLARQQRIEPASLKGEPMINTSAELDAGFWRHTDAVGTIGSFTPMVVRRAPDMVSVLSHVSAGAGVAVVSQSFSNMRIPNVVYREFATTSPPMSYIAFIHRRDEASPAALALIKHMRRFALPRS